MQFLDEMRLEADGILWSQTAAMRKQQLLILTSLLSLAFVGSIALLLLRREVLGRKAREQAEERVAFLAYFDSLTGLSNRTQFQDRLSAMLKTNETVALIYFDVDDFKTVNDTYGHAAGDQILCHIGKILSATTEAHGAFAARLAGDEFAVVLAEDRLAVLKGLCEAVIANIAQPFDYHGEAIMVSVSAGLATSDADGDATESAMDRLSRATDFALYASKSGGRNRLTVYDESLEKEFLAGRAMLDELPRAIENADIEVYLQPKVLLPEGTVFGFEALARWRRHGKIVSPTEFIAIAERSGVVVDIDNFIMRRATQVIASWNKAHRTNYSISVNLSAVHFTSNKTISLISSALAASGLAPELLTLEITETVEMRDWQLAQDIVFDIHQLGCKVAIDDFGSGYSSLAYLRSTPADKLKLDRTLLKGMESSKKVRLLLSSVLELAQNFEMQVIVEGVETPEQARLIADLGATQAQGYFFGRPAPAIEALEMFATPETRAVGVAS